MATASTQISSRVIRQLSRPQSPLAIWVTLAATSVVSILLYVALPGAASEAWFQVVAWASIASFFAGARRNDALRPPWVLVGAGFALFALGDLLFSLNQYLWKIDAFPSSADVSYLAGYPLLAVGLAALVRSDRIETARAALIDSGIIITPLAVAGWIYIIEPLASDGGSTALERAVSSAYPVGDLLCLAVLVRLLTGLGSSRGAAQPALNILVLGLTTLLALDILFLVQSINGTYVSGGWTDGMYLISYLAIGATGLCQSMNSIGAVTMRSDISLSRRRLGLLALAALIIPGLLTVQWIRGAKLTVPLVVGGTVISFLLVVARMSGLVQALESSRSKLRFEATHDALTGLPNRQLFNRKLEDTLRHGLGGSLLFVDLDSFKAINDNLGHHVGDSVLIEVAETMRTCVRDTDLVARLAGDEFVVLIQACDHDELIQIAQRVVDRLCISRGDSDGQHTITASVGLVTWQPGTSVERAHELIRRADEAMYRAKGLSGHQVVIASY